MKKMKKLIKTPQTFFIFLAILMIITGVSKEGSKLDFNYFLAFLLIDVWSVSLVSAVFFVLISFNYVSLYFTNKKPNNILTYLHISLQILALLPLLYYMWTSSPKNLSQNVSSSNITLLISFFIFLLSVTIHLINFFYSLFKKNNS